MSANLRVQLGTAATAEVLFEPICALYDQVFSQPPFLWTDEESQHHRDLLTALRQEPTFGIVTAEAAGQLIGFSYGYTLRPDTKWWGSFVEPLPEDLTREWPGRTFALIDLALDQKWRGQGIGRQLTETLTASRTEQRGTLSVQPTAVETQAFYQRLGWRKAGQKRMPPGVVSPLFDVYTLDFHPEP
jgi:ribosomal protein S18 acetylase RimI-like enzyme